MQCTNCHIEISALPGPCPNCGFVSPIQPPQPSFGSRNPMRVILLSFLGLLSIALLVQRVAIPAYRNVEASRISQERPAPTPRPEVFTTHFAVEHGRVAGPEDLHGHGKLYFVPVGRQAIFVRSLADYYANKFGIQIYLLPEVKLGPAACVPRRNQCMA